MSMHYDEFERVSATLAAGCTTKALRLFQKEFLRLKLLPPTRMTVIEILEYLYNLTGRALDIRERRN